ncbi:hypothetical protein STXM2123_2964 [Streptomyces sp. F-3]|nr:hypothetical protein STXM2123_2964 [Streptomyces sp. F-3]
MFQLSASVTPVTAFRRASGINSGRARAVTADEPDGNRTGSGRSSSARTPGLHRLGAGEHAE